MNVSSTRRPESVNELRHQLLALSLIQGKNQRPTLRAVPICGLRLAKKVAPAPFAVLGIQNLRTEGNRVGHIFMQSLPASEPIHPAWCCRGMREQFHGCIPRPQVYSFWERCAQNVKPRRNLSWYPRCLLSTPRKICDLRLSSSRVMIPKLRPKFGQFIPVE